MSDKLLSKAHHMTERYKLSLLAESIQARFADTNGYDIDQLYTGVMKLLADLGKRNITSRTLSFSSDFEGLRIIKDKQVEVFPGIFSTDRRFLKFLLDFENEFYRRFGKPTLDENGMAGPSGYARDLGRLRSVPGLYPKDGGGYPRDNSSYRKHLGLSQGLRLEDRELAVKFFQLLFGRVVATPVRVPDKSSAGLPLPINDRAFKRLVFEYAVKHLDDVCRRAREGDLRGLADIYNIMFLYVQGERTQSDSPGKIRKITRLEDMLKADYKEYIVDNKVELPKVPLALSRQFVARRFRYVWGQNAFANLLINCIGGSARESYALRYEFTFKHRSINHMRTKMNEGGGR